MFHKHTRFIISLSCVGGLLIPVASNIHVVLAESKLSKGIHGFSVIFFLPKPRKKKQ